MKYIYTFADSLNETYRVNIVLEEGDDKSKVIIPDSYNGKKVTVFDAAIFSRFGSELKTIVFGDNISVIYPSSLFENLTGLENIYLGKNIKSSIVSLEHCTNLKNVFYNGSREEWLSKVEKSQFGDFEKIDVRCGVMHKKVQLYQEGKPIFPYTHWDCIKEAPIYEEEVYENSVFTIPEIKGEEVCSDILTVETEKFKYVKIAETFANIDIVFSFASKAKLTDGSIKELFPEITKGTMFDAVTLHADSYVFPTLLYCKREGAAYTYNDGYGSKYSFGNFIETGLYVRVNTSARYEDNDFDGDYELDWDNAPDFATNLSEIYFDSIIKKLDIKFLPEEFTALQNDVEKLKSDISDIKSNDEEVSTSSIQSVEVLPLPEGHGNVVALTGENKAEIFKYCKIHIKTREELLQINEDGLATIDFSSAINSVPVLKYITNNSFRNIDIDGCINTICDYIYKDSLEVGKIKIGISIFDRQFKNGIKVLFSDVESDIGPHIELTKIVDGYDVGKYYALQRNLDISINKTEWYELQGGTYKIADISDLSHGNVISLEEEAYVVDYWATESEENYNNAKKSGLIVDYPMTVSRVILSDIIAAIIPKGIYCDDYRWVRLDEPSNFSESHETPLNTIEQVYSLPVPNEEGRIVALKSDITHQDYHFFHDCKIKSRNELITQNGDGTSFVDLTNATLINKTVHIGILPELERNYVNRWLWNMWEIELEKKRQEGADILNDPVYKGEAPDIGVCIYDKSWQNGIKIRYHLFLEDEGDEYIRVTKVVNGIDTEDYFYFAEFSISVEKYPYTQEEGWYKLVDGNYVMLAAEELPNFNLNFDQAYIVDYWAMVDEEEYNAVMNAGYSVGLPTALSSFIKKFVCVVSELKQGFYKYTNSEWVKWSAASEFSGSYNDLKDKPEIPSVEGFATTEYVNQLLDSFAALLDTANREVL